MVVVSDAGTCIGARAADHDLSGLAGHRLRTHGGVSEAKVPIIVSVPLNEAYRLKAATGTPKSWQVFDYALNGTRTSSMTTSPVIDSPLREGLRIGGEKVHRERTIDVCYPYTGEVVATVPKATVEDVRRALQIARQYKPTLTRYERYKILMRAGEIIASRKEALARLITLESGLCLKDSNYEVGRASDVLLFAANQALVDDGQVFSCDLTHHGKSRKVYTLREPLQGVISAITPFNHPLNQVIHKVAPSVATNNRMVLKPTEKTPLAAFALADILYEAGLPPEMLQVLTGDPAEIADELLTHEHIDLVTFTGGVPIGKYIAGKAVYKRTVLELGGNDPLIVMDDADPEKAAELAASGSYKNSGQRCTAVKRILVHQKVLGAFTEALLAKTRAWSYGDPLDPTVDMGTVIDEAAAQRFESLVNDAVGAGARLLHGNRRRGASYSPTLLDRVDPANAAGQVRDLRPGVADHRLQGPRRSGAHRQRHRLRAQLGPVHQPAGRHHLVREAVGGGFAERLGGARIPPGTDAFWRHQGFGPGLQGGRPGSHEELHQHQDLLIAVVEPICSIC